MRITELDWLKNNREKLSEHEVESLNQYDFFEQMKDGELSHPLPKLLELMKLAIDIYNGHHETKNETESV